MKKICLPKEYADKFLNGLKSGKISPSKLINMVSSEEREKYLSRFVGDNAKLVNTEFESKLLLKNQKRGMITWAERYAGLRSYDRKEIIDKINKLEKALSPNDKDRFLSDIVERRIGVKISYSQSKKIIELSSEVSKLQKPDLPNWQQSRDWAVASQKLNSYLRDLKLEVPKGVDRRTWFKNKVLRPFLSIERAILTGFDASASLRQGRAYFGTKAWNGAFRRQFGYAKSQLNLDKLEIDMMLNKYYEQVVKVKKDLGLTMLGENFTQREEEFGSKLIEKIPLLKNSERVYVGFLNDLRFYRFVGLIEQMEKNGIKITEDLPAMRELAKTISNASGRGSLGSASKAAQPLATVLFAPRWLTSRFQILLNPLTKKGAARKEATLALARLIGTTTAVLGLYKMAGGTVETDPRSSDFCKIKMGDSRLDISGGTCPVITLMSRMATSKTKSSTTGVLSLLNSGLYGSRTRFDVAQSFITNKLAPIPGFFRDWAKGETFNGKPLNLDTPENKKNFIKYIAKLFVPLTAGDYYDAYKTSSGDVALTSVVSGLSFFGIAGQSYKPSPVQQVRRLYVEDEDTEEAYKLLNAFVETGDISKSYAKRIKKEIDVPNDILYFKKLPAETQTKLLKKMKIEDIERFGWYAKKEVRENFKTISENTNEFIKLYRTGKVKRPQWKYQSIK